MSFCASEVPQRVIVAYAEMSCLHVNILAWMERRESCLRQVPGEGIQGVDVENPGKLSHCVTRGEPRDLRKRP